MKSLLRIVSISLLFFNGTGAVYGGLNLIMFPDGSQLHLSTALLLHTPFQNYFIPGLVLLLINGFCSFWVLTATVLIFRKYEVLIMSQGFLLSVWISVQVILIHHLNFLHIILGSVGLVLVFIGYKLYKIELNNARRKAI